MNVGLSFEIAEGWGASAVTKPYQTIRKDLTHGGIYRICRIKQERSGKRADKAQRIRRINAGRIIY
jgi:hypothetical protein